MQFNGKHYAQNGEEYKKLLANRILPNGYCRVMRGRMRLAILLMDTNRVPMALISPDGATVTAHRTPQGIRYMYGLTEDSTAFLGVNELSYSALSTIGRNAIKEAVA